MDIAALVQKMAVLFFSILVGFVAAKIGIIKNESNRFLSKLLVNITSPFLILSSVFKGEHLLSNSEVLMLTALGICCYLCMIALSFFIPKMLYIPAEKSGLYRFMFIFSNIGFIGYPIVSSLFGTGAIFYVSLFVLMFQIFCWSYGVSLISGEQRFRFQWKVFRQPCLIAALAAYVFYLSGLRVPGIVYEMTSYIGDLTSPLAMLVIGCALAQTDVRTVFGNWRIYALCALKMVIIPLLAYLVLRRIISNQLMLGVTMVILCMPIATNTTTICYEYGADTTLSAAGIFISTLLSFFSIPLIMRLLFG